MAAIKEKKPAILPLKSDLVPVDRKKHKSGVWEYFGIPASSWVVCLKWVDNNTTNMRHHLLHSHRIDLVKDRDKFYLHVLLVLFFSLFTI